MKNSITAKTLQNVEIILINTLLESLKIHHMEKNLEEEEGGMKESKENEICRFLFKELIHSKNVSNKY